MSQATPTALDRNRVETDIEQRVDEAVARLDDLDRFATPDHVAVFESVHEVLSKTLSAVDEA